LPSGSVGGACGGAVVYGEAVVPAGAAVGYFVVDSLYLPSFFFSKLE
jgi:hypothetical protein